MALPVSDQFGARCVPNAQRRLPSPGEVHDGDGAEVVAAAGAAATEDDGRAVALLRDPKRGAIDLDQPLAHATLHDGPAIRVPDTRAMEYSGFTAMSSKGREKSAQGAAEAFRLVEPREVARFG